MIASRVFSRISRTGLKLNQCRGILLRPEYSSVSSCNFHTLHDSSNKWVPSQVNLLNQLGQNGQLAQRFGFSSSASPQPNEKESTPSGDNKGASLGDKGTSTKAEPTKVSSDDESATEDEDSFGDLSAEELVKLVAEKEELLILKSKEMESMKDKFLRSYAELENVMGRTKREAENSKKFAIQNFAKSLLDVADNLGRASTVVKESFSKLDISHDSAGAVPLLKTLLEGVEMTDKQLTEVFRKYGVEKYDPLNEQFDPHRHNAVFQIPDGSKSPDIVAAVLKPGYMLYDRVIRPAEVGVTKAPDSSEADN